MDAVTIGFFLAAAFFGGLVSGLSGFAMGLVVSGVWLHIITPEQNALLIVLCGLVTQGSGIWRVRHAINWRTVAAIHCWWRDRRRHRHCAADGDRSRHAAHHDGRAADRSTAFTACCGRRLGRCGAAFPPTFGVGSRTA